MRQFAADAETCLFGTLSLWQGVDVPGRLLRRWWSIDRIPFPPPDDPLAQGPRSMPAGPAGFMAVSVADAALLLAQGAGRLIRSHEDRGVVAVLDSRRPPRATASFLLRSLPPFWRTDDGAIARAALRRLAGE